MSSLWKIGSVDIYVNKFEESPDPKIAELVPLDSGGTSILHFFGSAARKLSIGGIVISETNKNALLSLAENFTTVAVTSDQGSLGNFKIQQINVSRNNVVRVNVPGYSPTATVYSVQLRLVEA